jgi:hypothetical protein
MYTTGSSAVDEMNTKIIDPKQISGVKLAMQRYTWLMVQYQLKLI